MSNIATSIDWLRVTQDYGELDLMEYLPNTKGGPLEDCRPMRPYSEAKRNRYFSVHWCDRHPEWRVMIEMNGTQLSDYRKDGQSENSLFKWVRFVGANVTRVDYAVDLFDCGGTPTDVRECFFTGQLDTIAHSVSIVEKNDRNGTKGATVYVGSRSSERLVRVYDKGKQKKTNLDWVRVEMELKGKRAMQFADLAAQEGYDTVGKSSLADVIEWSDIPWFESIWKEDYTPVDIDALGRPETDREKWLRTVIIPILAEEAESGSAWLVDALEAILQQARERSEHGPRIVPHSNA